MQEVIRVLATREKEGEGSRFDRLRWERELVEIRAELALARRKRRRPEAGCLSSFRRYVKLPKLRARLALAKICRSWQIYSPRQWLPFRDPRRTANWLHVSGWNNKQPDACVIPNPWLRVA